MTPSSFPPWPRFSIDPQGRAFVPPRIQPPIPSLQFDTHSIPRAQALTQTSSQTRMQPASLPHTGSPQPFGA